MHLTINRKAPPRRGFFFLGNHNESENSWLKLILVLFPEVIILIIGIVLFPLLTILFFPFIGNGCILTGGLGGTARVGIDLYSSGTTIAFI